MYRCTILYLLLLTAGWGRELHPIFINLIQSTGFGCKILSSKYGNCCSIIDLRLHSFIPPEYSNYKNWGLICILIRHEQGIGDG